MSDNLLCFDDLLHVVDSWELILDLEYLNQSISLQFIVSVFVLKHFLDVELVLEIFIIVGSLLGREIFCLSSDF